MSVLLFFVVAPLAGAFLIALAGRKIKYSAGFCAGLISLGLSILSFYAAGLISRQQVLVFRIGGWTAPLGISLVGDGLSALMLVVVNVISFLVVVYATSYMKLYTDKWNFYALFMLMLSGLNGIIISGDLFNLYIFLEVASLSGYALVAFGTEPEDLEAAFKYLIMGALASIFILLGIGFIYSYTSTLNMADIQMVLSVKPKGAVIGFVSVLFLAGFGLKAALVPFHAWLPDAHSSAPTPVSAILSGIFIKTVGIYCLARVFFNIVGVSEGLLSVLMVLGALSMVAGAFLAIGQSDIKRMFAYSSISQVGYIILALGIATPLAIFGGLFHLFNHAVGKSLLFLSAGSIERSSGSRDLLKISGLGEKLPVTGYASLMGSLSISGIPPLGGFWSKAIIILAAIQSGHGVYAVIAALVSVVTLVYYFKFYNRVFFGLPVFLTEKIQEASFAMKFSMIALAFVALFAGILLLPAFRPLFENAANCLSSGSGYAASISGVLP